MLSPRWVICSPNTEIFSSSSPKSNGFGLLAKLAALHFGSSLDENLWRLGAHSELCKPKKLQIIAKMRQKACCDEHF